MLTKLTIHNFKTFGHAEIELGDAVVFVGPNNAGKTTALQALSLWDVARRRWLSKRRAGSTAQSRVGVTVNRRDLLTVPVPSGRLLWHDLNVRTVSRDSAGKQDTRNVLMELTVDGVEGGASWTCGLEFDYANEESFYVRPRRIEGPETQGRMEVPVQAHHVKMAYLPPMSGLAAEEFVKQPGETAYLIGQGQTAQVLRNICYRVCYPGGDTARPSAAWMQIVERLNQVFGVKLDLPKLQEARSEITMGYRERGSGANLDITAAGRGLQQTLLLLAYIYDNPGSVLLLDEPDAHLEVLRQRHTFQLIREIAAEQGAQIIAASHSEVVLNEAASTGKLVAFIGRPHTLTDKPSQLIKALTDIGWEHYYEAELKGWVLYVEDASDLLVLKELAKLLDHPASTALENSYVHYISTNVPVRAREHFFGLQEAKPDLVGIALFDRIDKPLQSQRGLEEVMWSKREIENYFCRPEVLLRWVRHNGGRDLFALAEADDAEPQMNRAVDEVAHALQVLGKDPWGSEVKASEEVLDAIFRLYYQLVGSPIVFRKAQYFQLVPFLTPEEVDPEVSAVLDRILAVSKLARPPE